MRRLSRNDARRLLLAYAFALIGVSAFLNYILHLFGWSMIILFAAFGNLWIVMLSYRRDDRRQQQTEIRPRAGWVYRPDGTHYAVRFVPTENPAVFTAVTVDGEPIVLQHGDVITADALGAGQRIRAQGAM